MFSAANIPTSRKGGRTVDRTTVEKIKTAAHESCALHLSIAGHKASPALELSVCCLQTTRKSVPRYGKYTDRPLDV